MVATSSRMDCIFEARFNPANYAEIMSGKACVKLADLVLDVGTARNLSSPSDFYSEVQIV